MIQTIAKKPGHADINPPSESVAAEIAAGDELTLSAVARQHHTATTTVFRWVQRGLADGTGAVDRMQSFLMRGVLRSEEARKQLAELGLDYADLKELGPADRVQRIRKSLARVRNAARRATLQAVIFGQEGADLNLDGGRIFLEAVRRGKVWYTSSAAVRRFFERLECSGPPPAPTMRTPAQLDRDCARTEQELRDLGVNF
jgi:hypothetical protein